ncbi:MAG: sulfatase-like hydrolase/transferase, partial [Verrucomicrobiota bacterium]
LGPCTIGGWPSFAGSLYGELRIGRSMTGATYTNWTKVVSDGTSANTTTSTVSTYATTDVVNDAVSWIQTQTNAGKPWFAWCAFNAPHIPFHLPSPTSLCPHYTTLSGTTQDITAHPLNYYNAAVEALDTEIGRLLASVDLTKTTVIFIGDNGTPGQVLQTPYSVGHGKGSLYEGGIRVPLIIRGPDVVSPGRSADVLTHVVDLNATILDLAGISTAATVPSGVTLDSQSLMPVLQNQPVSRSRLYAELFDTNAPTTGGRTLRDDQYKIIRLRTGIDQFFDLQADPYENTNLLADGVNAMTATRQSYYYRLRFDLGRYTTATTPATSNPSLQSGKFSVTVAQNTGATQTMYRCTDLTNGFWAPATGATTSLTGINLTFTDPAPPAGSAFYSILAESP